MRRFRGLEALRHIAFPEPGRSAQAQGRPGADRAEPQGSAAPARPRVEEQRSTAPECSAVAPEQRAIRLLRDNLTLAQFRQFASAGCFDVAGGESGKRYRLWYCRQQNIEELDAEGGRICIWCFHPSDLLPLGDVLLAQKTALELFECDALRIANSYSDFAPVRVSDRAQNESYEDFYYRTFHTP
jgi:hypothetical protein